VIDQESRKAELLRREVKLKNLLKRQEMERQIPEIKTREDELKRRIALLAVEGETVATNVNTATRRFAAYGVHNWTRI